MSLKEFRVEQSKSSDFDEDYCFMVLLLLLIQRLQSWTCSDRESYQEEQVWARGEKEAGENFDVVFALHEYTQEG